MVAAFEFNTVRGTDIISVYLGGVPLGGSIVTPVCGVEFVSGCESRTSNQDGKRVKNAGTGNDITSENVKQPAN